MFPAARRDRIPDVRRRFGVQWAYPFLEPVDTVKYDNYLDFVRRPMDLGTVRGDIEAGHYPDPGALLLDLRQVPCRPLPRVLAHPGELSEHMPASMP